MSIEAIVCPKCKGTNLIDINWRASCVTVTSCNDKHCRGSLINPIARRVAQLREREKIRIPVITKFRGYKGYKHG